ncbi:MAG: glycine cleavage system aminomethyltransferase GcvT [Candidatus Eisenbacteria bacterium]|nr:glycine cleavage system aminomethyltransferase GcvT [Candidatus Eisenbacteria bacterium]
MPTETPFIRKHKEHGARLVEFAGFMMPVSYKGIIHEHTKVRESAGVFDVSHMGEIIVKGPRALETVNFLITNDASELREGDILYSPMCNERGGIVDDILVYNLGNSFLLVVNASNTEKDFNWIKRLEKDGVVIENASDRTAQLALQGPLSEKIASRIFGDSVRELQYYKHAKFSFRGKDLLVSRTGYTGEDGFEIYHEPDLADKMWDALFEAGRDAGLEPIGLGARDTLRLEMSYCLYGNDIDDTTSPLEAGIAWTVKLEKGRFQGREVLLKQKEDGLKMRLVAFEMDDERIPRKGNKILSRESTIGTVTSGSYSPSLEKGIGMGYVNEGVGKIGDKLNIQTRENQVSPATIVKKPFYRKASHK